MPWLFYFIFCVGYVFCNVQSPDEEITHLFFANLRRNSLSEGVNLTDGIKQDIDLQVRNYNNLIEDVSEVQTTFHRNRRGLDSRGRLRKDINGVQKLKEFKELLSFRVQSPQDMMLFRHKNDLRENWYAAVIENDSDIIAMHLVIYKFNGDDNFSEIYRRKICYAHKLSSFTMQEFTIILVAECCTISDTSSVYRFDYEENVTKIQSLNMSNARDVSFWENQNNVYMGIAHHLTEDKDVANYEVETPIYKWTGTYFDVVNTLTTYGSTTLTGFTIGNSMFIAVANRLNNNGDTNIYSEIFKYNRHFDRFLSHQKVHTNGAIDIKYFCFQQYQKKESYLIITDSFTDKDYDDGVTREFHSIIYKYVDGFFLPFQSIRINNLIEWQPFVGSYGKFALIAVCQNRGIKIYQYDGWKFVPVEIKNMPDKLINNIVAVHSHIFQEETVLVIANRLSVDIFQTNFEEDQEFNEFYDDMLHWCNAETKIIENGKKPNLNSNEVKIKRQAQVFNNENVEDVELIKLRNILESRRQFLESQQQEIDSQPLDLDINIIEDLVANEIIINNEAFLSRLTAQSVNDIDVVDFLRNIIYIRNGFVVGETFDLDNITVLNELAPAFVNNKAVSDILTKGHDIILSDLIVEGNIIFEDIVQVNGTINNIQLKKEELLLLSEDQTFETDLNVANVAVNKLTTKFLNKLEIAQAHIFNKKPVFVDVVKALSVESIVVEGFVNLIDISAIDKLALRKSGDQDIGAEYIFDNLVTSDMDVLDSLSNVKIPESLSRIDTGYYNISKDVQFTGDVTIDNIILTQRFNHINVRNGRLDVLLKQSPHIQQITGIKKVQEVELKHPVNLQGKLNISGMENMNPLTIVDEGILLNGDFILSGTVIIEEAIIAEDIVAKESDVCVSRLRQHGLKLEDDTIDAFVEFVQPLDVEIVDTPSINSLSTESFIVANTNNSQNIVGTKEISNDLYLDGKVILHYVNGIDFIELISNTLMINGDQTIAGNIILEEIDVDNVTSLNTKIGQRDWNSLLTSNDESVSGITEVNGPVNVKTLNANSVEIRGTINNINFDAMIEDTAFPNHTIYKLNGRKIVQNLIVDSINVENNLFDVTSPFQLLTQPEIVFDANEIIRLPTDLVVQNLIFKYKLNHLSATQFNSGLLKPAPRVTFTEDQYLDNVIIAKEMFLASDHINDLNLTDFNENALRHTESHHFASATFEDELVSPGLIKLDGHIENFDLENVVLVSEKSQNLLDNILFLEDVFINGELTINGSVNSKMILEDIWDMVAPSEMEAERHMIINGSAFFAKGPEVDLLNGFRPRELMEASWISHENTQMNKNAIFQNVVFKKSLNLDGFLDQINVDWLSKNYLSKTKDQNIIAHYFIPGINFAQGVSAPIAKVKGSLFGVNLLEFMRTALLNNLDQVFEEPLFFEQAIFNNIEGLDYTVNNMDLANDVMRYDIENIVSGFKSIPALEVQNLDINHGAQIQNVDVIQWFQSAAMKTHSFQMKGKMVINNNVTFRNGVGLEGLLNHNVFNEDTVLLRSKPQGITGIKTFVEHPVFASIIVNGFINGVNLTELLDNQVYRVENIRIFSPISINSKMSTNKLQFNSLWNGVDLSKMIDTMKNSDDIEYHHEKFDNLLMITNEIQRSFENRAYFLDDYKLEGTFENGLGVIPIKFSDGNHRLAILREANETNIISFFMWDEISQFAIDIGSLQIIYNQDVSYINAIDFDSFSYLYIETELVNLTLQTTHEGNLIRVSNQSSFEIIHKIHNNGTKLVHSFILPDQRQNCLAFLYNIEMSVDILCEIGGVLQIFEKIEAESATHLTSSIIDGITYIFLINGATERGEACIQVWKFDQHTRLFNINQIIHTVTPNSLSVVTFNDVGYLAISSERIEETDYTGQVEIRRFDPSTQHFLPHFQVLPSSSKHHTQQPPLHLPEQVLFAVLPSNELVLYVRTADAVQPLLVYRYRGVERFVQEIAATTVLPLADLMRQYTDRADNHFLVWRHQTDADERVAEVSLIKAVMQGVKEHS